MKLEHERDVVRVSADSRLLMDEARRSCEISAAHIKSSRKALARSLRLLGKPFHQSAE